MDFGDNAVERQEADMALLQQKRCGFERPQGTTLCLTLHLSSSFSDPSPGLRSLVKKSLEQSEEGF